MLSLKAARCLWLVALTAFAATPAWAQTTNQLYMTGAASGSQPGIQATGVDTNISVILTPKGTGGVGIGTASPSAPLHVIYHSVNTSNTTPALILDNPSGSSQETILSLRVNNVAEANMRTDAAGNLVLSTAAGGTVFIGALDLGVASPINLSNGALNITSTGSVGIGTATPQTGYILTTNGNIYVGGYVTMTSDQRMKKNIRSLESESALNKIAALRPVTFTWKKTGQPDMGLIAQEVKPVFPDLVKRGADDKLGLEYMSLLAPVISSIQELKKRDEEVETENEALRREFEAYKQDHP